MRSTENFPYYSFLRVCAALSLVVIAMTGCTDSMLTPSPRQPHFADGAFIFMPDAQPADSAKIAVFRHDDTSGIPVLETVTGPDGFFGLDSLGSGIYTVCARRKRLAAIQDSVVITRQGAMLASDTLQPSVTLYGTVSGSENTEDPGLNVRVVGTDIQSADQAEGTFLLTDLSPGRYTLQLATTSQIAYRPITIDATAGGNNVHLSSFSLENGVRVQLSGQAPSLPGAYKSAASQAQHTIEVKKGAKKPFPILGFGCCANTHPPATLWEDPFTAEDRELIYDRLWTDKKNGIDLSFVRLSADAHRFYNKSSGWDWDAFKAEESNHRWDLIEQVMIRDVENMYFNLFTPPRYMKTNNNTVGGRLKPEYRDDLGRVFAEFMLYIQEQYGKLIEYASMQNEPHQTGLHYKSCEMTPQEFRDAFLVWSDVIKSTPGLESVKCGGAETSFAKIDDYIDAFSQQQLAKLDWVNYHGYAWRDHTNYTNRYNKPVICTEDGEPHGWDNPDENGKDIYTKITMDNAFIYTNKICRMLNAGEVGYQFWMPYRLTIPGEGLMVVRKSPKEIIFPKRFWGMGHFSKFIRPGYYIVDTDNDLGDKARLTAAVDPAQGTTVVVVVNEQSSGFSVEIKGFGDSGVSVYQTDAELDMQHVTDLESSNNSVVHTIAPQSITTLTHKRATVSIR